MTKREKEEIAHHRRKMLESAADMALLIGRLADPMPDAIRVGEMRGAAAFFRDHSQKIVELVSDAHCGDCGAHESEPCAETCGERVTEGA